MLPDNFVPHYPMGLPVIRGAISARSTRLLLAMASWFAAGVTLVILLRAQRSRLDPERLEFEHLAVRNEHYAG